MDEQEGKFKILCYLGFVVRDLVFEKSLEGQRTLRKCDDKSDNPHDNLSYPQYPPLARSPSPSREFRVWG